MRVVLELDLLELRNASRMDPFGDIDIAVGVKACIVWMNELAIVPFRFIAANGEALIIDDSLLIIAESGYGFIVGTE